MNTISNFEYDRTTSHMFGLVIANLNGGAVSEKNTFGNMDVLFDKAGNRPMPFYYGVSKPQNLEFPLEIYNKYGLHYEQYEVQAIEEWLFNRKKPCLLTIFDPDKGNESFECWLTGSNQIVRLDKRVIGWKFNVVCSSAYMLTNVIEERFDCPNEENTFTYFNLSNINDYIYPEMNIKLASKNANIRIDNQQDPHNPFIITGVRKGDSIYVNNNLGYISAASGDNIFNKFNLNFFRFVDGHNKLTVSGKCVITFKNRFYKTGSGY